MSSRCAAKAGLAGALAAMALAALLPVAASAAPRVELVQTVPIETELGHGQLPHTLDVWLEMIRGAQRSIDLEGFYLSDWPGESMRPVLEALGAAGRRGVKVRVLLDRGMHRTYPQPADSMGTLPGIQVRTIDARRIMGGVQHAKYFLVDGEQVFLGSQNFDWRALEHIHELGVRVRDVGVTRAFARVFDWDWAAADTTTWVALARPESIRAGTAVRLETKRPRPPRPHRLAVPITIAEPEGESVRVWPSYSPRGWIPDSTRWDLPAIVRLLDGARRDVSLQLLSYSPEEYGEADSTLDQALRRAGARGVKVRMLISDWVVNSRGLKWLQRLAQAPGIEVKLSTLPEWSGGYIPFARVEHSKYVVADGAWLWIGTSNWGPGYFTSSRNLALVFESERLARQARQVFEIAWSAPSAASIRIGETYPEKIRGLEPPPGKKAYGS